MPSEICLRLHTFNLWHGLNHTQPLVMLPLENPLQKKLRRKALYRGILELLLKYRQDPTPSLNFFAFQEVNPIQKTLQTMKNTWSLDGASIDVNVGLRVGNLSYPFYLQEGLASLWNADAFKLLRSAKQIISGNLFQGRMPLLGWPLQLHFSEIRGALFVLGEHAGKKILFVNTHLHHGPPPAGLRHSPRRLEELQKILHTINTDFREADLVFFMGDFNCGENYEEYELILQNSFVDLGRSPTGEIVTWDPVNNPLCRRNAHYGEDKGQLEWDKSARQFDHIFGRFGTQKAPPFVTKRIFDRIEGAVMASDHYGLVTEIRFGP